MATASFLFPIASSATGRPRVRLYDRRVARFLIVGEGERALALADLIERDGHVVGVEPFPNRGSLEHVAIVCWLSEESPEWFLERAVDSSMRGFLHTGSNPPRVALRNRIPAASLAPTTAAEGTQGDANWLREAAAAIAILGIHLKVDRLS